MGKLTEKCRKLWKNFSDECNAADNLKAALAAGDKDSACKAISHARPHRDPYEDRVIRALSAYAEKSDCDTLLLAAAREAVYTHFDEKIRLAPDIFAAPEDRNRTKAGYKNPEYIYGIAAYMNDTKKLRDLGAKGIRPDDASNRALSESIVMGTIRMKKFDAMREVIRQGASLDKTFGFDEFPPIHYVGKPQFHDFNPGVTEALLQTGNHDIRRAMAKGLGEEFVDKAERKLPKASVANLPPRKHKPGGGSGAQPFGKTA